MAHNICFIIRQTDLICLTCEATTECKYYGNTHVINYIKVNIYDVKKECVDILITDSFSLILSKTECEIGSLKYFLRILIIFFHNLDISIPI